MNSEKDSRIFLIAALFALLLLAVPVRGCLTAPALRGETSFVVIDQFVVINIDEIRTRLLKNESGFFVVLEAVSPSNPGVSGFEMARAEVSQGKITDSNLRGKSLTSIVLTADFKPPLPGEYKFKLLLLSAASPQKILDSYQFTDTYYVINACYRQFEQDRPTRCHNTESNE